MSIINRFCPNCGTNLVAENLFCPHCGKDQRVQVPLQQEAPQQVQLPQLPPTHTARNLALVGLSLVVILAFFAAPFMPVASVSGPFQGVDISVSLTSSLSYQLFQCGEVHLVASAVIASFDRYAWVCGHSVQPSDFGLLA